MVAIAIVVFVLNTGVLNEIAGQIWDPFRQHLEGLLPLADPNQRQQPAQVPVQQAGPNADASQRRQGEPDPADAARRLMAERRNNNANWFLDQVRRVERASLLFLASIAPGVAERHIAHLEAQERAERQRREAAEAEAAAAAAAAAAANEQAEQSNADNSDEQVQTAQRDGGDAHGQPVASPAPNAEVLVDI